MKPPRAFLTVCLTLCLCMTAIPAQAGETYDKSDWITMLLVCNEGMLNDGGNVGNTIMIVSMNPQVGVIKELVFLWDTFVQYPGYETTQLLDQPFRVKGPEESLRIFNMNFQQEIESYLSLNFLNLSYVIDTFGGVTVDISRGERNALNGMVSAKIESAMSALTNLVLDPSQYESLFDQYYLAEYGPDTRLSGLQAVGYGWLQHDSIYNCCMRELEVIAQLFFQIRVFMEERVYFHRSDVQPDLSLSEGKRVMNVDDMTEEDWSYLQGLISPVFDNSAHNLDEETIRGVIETLLRSTYLSAEKSRTSFDRVQMCVLPLEYEETRVRMGSASGIVIDYELNRQELERFLYDVDYSPMEAQPKGDSVLHAARD